MQRGQILPLIVAFVASCSKSPSTPFSSEAVGGTIELISPSNCSVFNGHLEKCAIPSATLTYDTFETAVALRTTVGAQESGNCATQFPLQVGLTPNGDSSVSFPYIQGGQMVVRAANGQAISSLQIVDNSPWTKTAVLDQSCRISMTITPNVPDVDTKADAQAMIDRLVQDVANSQAARDQALALDRYQKAFTFLRSVVDNFLGQLTSDQMQHLRTSAADAQPSLEMLITSCGNLSQDQRLTLLRLELGLSTLGHPEDWRNPNGTTKTLKDFLGPSQQDLLAVLDQRPSSGDGGDNYDALYAQAEAKYQVALHRLTLARQQLAVYLN